MCSVLWIDVIKMLGEFYFYFLGFFFFLVHKPFWLAGISEGVQSKGQVPSSSHLAMGYMEWRRLNGSVLLVPLDCTHLTMSVSEWEGWNTCPPSYDAVAQGVWRTGLISKLWGKMVTGWLMWMGVFWEQIRQIHCKMTVVPQGWEAWDSYH